MLEERTAIGFHDILFELDVTAIFPLCISQCKTQLFHPLGERILRHEVGLGAEGFRVYVCNQKTLATS